LPPVPAQRKPGDFACAAEKVRGHLDLMVLLRAYLLTMCFWTLIF
jgi:hypothetical protein